MDDIVSEVASAIGALRIGVQSVSALLSLTRDVAAKQKIVDALTKVEAAQETLFRLHGQLLTLQSENEKLRKQLKRFEDWEERCKQYELNSTDGGAVVYKYRGEPEHYACPSCFDNRHEVQILSSKSVAGGKFACPNPSCRAEFSVKRPQARQLPDEDDSWIAGRE